MFTICQVLKAAYSVKQKLDKTIGISQRSIFPYVKTCKSLYEAQE